MRVSTRRPATLVAALALALIAALAVSPAGATDDARWFRVQFDATITADDRAALARTGAEALQYVPHHAYVAYGTADTRAAAAALAGVTGVRDVTLAEKVDPQLRHRVGVTALAVVGHPRVMDAGAIGAVGQILARHDIGAGSPLGLVEVRAPAAAARTLAQLPGVLHVGIGTVGLRTEDEGSGQILAGKVAGTATPEPGYEQFLADRGLDGEGITISVVDDGLDPLHPELAGRIVKRYDYSAENTVVPAEGHGTHVAGILGGKGAEIPAAGRMTDGNGLLYGLGIAPKVTFVDQPVIQLATSVTSFPPPGGFPRIAQEAIASGAVAWNASWTDGGGAGAGYVANAAVMDSIVRDGDASTEEHQPFSLVFSAGNSGGPEHRITSPKEAKNIISVASSRGHRAGHVDMVSSFSSRGPARDGRVVPTVTAPGETIASARATTGALCGTEPLLDTAGLYSTCSGTSMASPQVAGAVALVHQWWRNANDGADPSPAMIKALLVNSAKDMRRRDIPNRDEGWGRVDLGALFDDAVERVVVDQSVLLRDAGAAHQLAVEPVDPARPMKATLVWTDAPGAPNANPALVNDLDLTLTAGDGTVWRGNNFADGVSQPGGTPDRLNNVENVFLDQPAGGYEVTVAAANLPGDGVPGNGIATDQDFALVLTNARLVP
ncbi:MAG TPA: S8 family serine peptidase [Egibacteraceae bacterium]|nr:S8 family serine peptidase [Egibacteraceae bacterium]